MKNPSEYLGFLLEILPILRNEIQAARQIGLKQEIKSDGSWVTAADKATELKFRELITTNFPDHGVMGEEYGTLNPTAEYVWVIDPIDGTSEFRSGMPEWATVIGLFYKGENIVGVIDCSDLDMQVFAAKNAGAYYINKDEKIKLTISDSNIQEPHRIKVGMSPRFAFNRLGHNTPEIFDALCEKYPNQRILHNAYIHLLVAISALHFSVEYCVRLWDIAAFEIIIKEAGGTYELISKTAYNGEDIYSIIAGEPKLVREALALIRK